MKLRTPTHPLERVAVRNLDDVEEFLQGEEQQVQSQQIACGASQPGARQHPRCQQSVTRGAEGQVHGARL